MTKRDKPHQQTVHIQMDLDMLAALDRISAATGIRQRAATIRYLIVERVKRDRAEEQAAKL